MDHRPWTAAGPAADDTGPDGTVTPELTGAQGPIALVAANSSSSRSTCPGARWSGLLGEKFPHRIRAAALSLAAAAQWVANWVITVSLPSLKDVSLGLA